MSRILPSATAYLVQHGPYWAISTKDGFGWILDRQISDQLQPGVFTKEEADFFRNQFPDCTIHQQQPYSGIPNYTQSEPRQEEPDLNASYQREGESQPEPKPQQTTTQPAEQQQGFDVMGKIGQAAGQATNILTKPWQKAIAPYIAVLYVFLFVGVFFVALWNIGPYEVAVRFIASRFGTSALVPFLMMLPVIGWILSAIGYLIFWIVGAVVWAIIQLIELLPIVMTYNPGYVRNVLQEQEAHESLRPDKNDPGVVRYLKKFYNQFPMRFLVIARRLRVWIYVLDMLIVMMVYPPVREGGIGRFFFLLATGQWGQFDWVNIILMFVTLFAMEAVVKLLLTVKHFRDYLKQTKRQPQAA